MAEALSPAASPDPPPLFITDDELHSRVAPHLGRDRFRAALRSCENSDPLFPRLSPLWRGRYWPAVRAWFDNDQGVRGNAVVATAQDGPETFDAAPRKSTGPQRRPLPAGAGQTPALLVREERRAGHNGLPDACIPLPADVDEEEIARLCHQHTARLHAWIEEQK